MELVRLFLEAKMGTEAAGTEWQKEVRTDLNIQEDSNSCGIWLMANMRNIVQGIQTPISQKDIPNVRYIMTYELKYHQLIGTQQEPQRSLENEEDTTQVSQRVYYISTQNIV